MNLLEFSKDNPPPPGTLDKGETAFDPAKHSPRVNKNTLRWMPKSPGRFHKRPNSATPPIPETASAPASATSPAGMTPVREVSADTLLDLPPAPPASPEAKPDVAPSTPPPAAAAPIPDVAPAGDAGTPGASAEASRGGDAKQSAAHAGKLAARATYAVAGAVLRDHKAAKPSTEEHNALASTWTAFFEFRGVALVGFFAVGAAILCYLLEDARREPFVAFVKGLFAKKPEKRAEPAAAPVTASGTKPAPDSSAAHPVIFPE